MAVSKGALTTGEDYASAADLLAADDLPHETLTVWGWKKNGAPLKIRVRGLSLTEREEVRAGAWLPNGMRDNVTLYLGYIQRGVVVPQLNEQQARQLMDKHAATVEQIANYISVLTEMDYSAVTALANELATNDAESASDNDTERSSTEGAAAARKAA
jgi:hypothetical protein